MAILALAAAPAHAQHGEGGLDDLLRECRTMTDTGSRMACYDAIPLDDGEPLAPPPRAQREAPASAVFGGNQLRAPSDPEATGPERISAKVASAVERQPGVWLLTLEDGAQWQFVDGAPAAYDPPRRGSTVEISKAAMGSYLVRYAGQRSVRARRVR